MGLLLPPSSVQAPAIRASDVRLWLQRLAARGCAGSNVARRARLVSWLAARTAAPSRAKRSTARPSPQSPTPLATGRPPPIRPPAQTASARNWPPDQPDEGREQERAVRQSRQLLKDRLRPQLPRLPHCRRARTSRPIPATARRAPPSAGQRAPREIGPPRSRRACGPRRGGAVRTHVGCQQSPHCTPDAPVIVHPTPRQYRSRGVECAAPPLPGGGKWLSQFAGE